MMKGLLAQVEKEVAIRGIDDSLASEVVRKIPALKNRRVVGGYGSVTIVDREGHKITKEALVEATTRFMDEVYYKNVQIFHSDVTIGRVLPAWTNPKTGETIKTHVDDMGWYVVCLAPETQIRTTQGYKNITEVKIGDKVYTHLCGKSFPVTQVMERDVDEEIAVIYLAKQKIRITKEHPILTKRGWIKAGEIVKGDICLHTIKTLLPAGIQNGTVVRWVSTEHYKGKVYNLEVEKAHSYSGKNIIFHNCEIRDDVEIADKVWEEVERGNIRSFSIAGSSKSKTEDYENGRSTTLITKLDIYEITLCEEPVNPMSKFDFFYSPNEAWM